MARARGWDGLQIWGVAANIWNRLSLSAERGLSSSLGVGWRAGMLRNATESLGLLWICGFDMRNEKRIRIVWTGSTIAGYDPAAGSSGHGNEPSGSMKDEWFLNQLSDSSRRTLFHGFVIQAGNDRSMGKMLSICCIGRHMSVYGMYIAYICIEPEGTAHVCHLSLHRAANAYKGVWLLCVPWPSREVEVSDQRRTLAKLIAIESSANVAAELPLLLLTLEVPGSNSSPETVYPDVFFVIVPKNWATTASFPVLSISVFINRPLIRRFVIWDTDSVVK
jgi:hypothetical protein